MAIFPLPPPELDGDDFPRLNSWLYGTEPHEYFDARFHLLVAYAAKPALLREAVREGLKYGGLEIGTRDQAQGATDSPGADAEESLEERERRHRQFVIADSVAVLHHASETLLRFYLAHSCRPGCPWLEIAKELNYAGFKQNVRNRFDGAALDDGRRRELTWTFFRSELPRDGKPIAEWNRDAENVERWMTHFASVFLDDSHLFNVIKHGLTVQAGESSMKLGKREDGEPLLYADGPSVAFLEKTGDPPRWHYTTRWIDPARLMAETTVALRLLQGVWQLGRLRYTDHQRPPDDRLSVYVGPPYEEYMTSVLKAGEDARVILNRMSMNLSYRYACQPELVCAVCGRTPAEGEQAHTTWRGRRESDDQPYETICPGCAARDAEVGSDALGSDGVPTSRRRSPV